jgi:hypothetical protein
MFPTTPTLLVLTLIVAGTVVSTVGLSAFWAIFAVTLVVTTAVAIHRSIPRKEK